MELHGYLSNNVRMLSAGSGAFEPECLRMASELNLPGLELAEVLDLITAGDDEALFRRILVAQMNELADCLPTVFGHVDDADALTSPTTSWPTASTTCCSTWLRISPRRRGTTSRSWAGCTSSTTPSSRMTSSNPSARPRWRTWHPPRSCSRPTGSCATWWRTHSGRLWMLNNPGSRLREGMAYYIEA